MNLNPYFKSVLDQDRASIVLCGLDHTILYMNPAAIRSYAKHGGAALVGRSLANCHNAHSNEMIQTVVDWFAASPEHNLIYTYHGRLPLCEIQRGRNAHRLLREARVP